MLDAVLPDAAQDDTIAVVHGVAHPVDDADIEVEVAPRIAGDEVSGEGLQKSQSGHDRLRGSARRGRRPSAGCVRRGRRPRSVSAGQADTEAGVRRGRRPRPVSAGQADTEALS